MFQLDRVEPSVEFKAITDLLLLFIVRSFVKSVENYHLGGRKLNLLEIKRLNFPIYLKKTME